jgi:hypothetical protein
MDPVRKMLTQKLISLADDCLALLETRGAVINGRCATSLRDRLQRARAGQSNEADRQGAADPSHADAGTRARDR